MVEESWRDFVVVLGLLKLYQCLYIKAQFEFVPLIDVAEQAAIATVQEAW